MIAINKRILLYSFLLVMSAMLLLSTTSCVEVDNTTSTHELMQGVWEVDVVYNENGEDITKDVTSLLPAYMHLDDQNSVNSTCGPLFMYIVYGKSKFIKVVSRIDEVFNYTGMKLTEGEWFIVKDGEVNEFTCEIKMKFPTTSTLKSILAAMGGIQLGFIDKMVEAVIYHKFINIGVEFSDFDPNTMTWIIDDQVDAVYNTKNQYGELNPWLGVATNTFSKCTIHWVKRKRTINQLIQESNHKNR